MELTVSEFFKYLLKRWWVIVLAILAGFILSYLSAAFLMEKQYESSIMLVYEDAQETTDKNKAYVQRAVDDVVASNVYLKELADYLGKNNTESEGRPPHEILSRDFTYQNLAKVIKTEYNNATLRMTFVVRTANARDSKIIADAMYSDHMIKELAEILGIGSNYSNRFKKIADPELNPEAVSPNVAMYTFVGIFSGLIVGILLCFIIEKLDVRIKGEEDLLERYDLPILGIIPSMLLEESDK